MKNIGPSFASELKEAGLTDGVAWTSDGILSYSDEATDDYKNAVVAVLLDHDSTKSAPTPIPASVSRFQGREAMHMTPHGDTTLFAAAEAILNDPATPGKYVRGWADLQEFSRDSEMLIAVSTELGLTSKQVDDLFILAASVRV